MKEVDYIKRDKRIQSQIKGQFCQSKIKRIALLCSFSEEENDLERSMKIATKKKTRQIKC